MTEIIVALITACTHLTQNDTAWRNEKALCVQRVAKCADEATTAIKYDEVLQYRRILRECSKEVHL